MPSAIEHMTRAVQNAGLISEDLGLEEATQQMFKLQEQGKLLSSKVLPEFAKVLRESASKGLEKALNSNRVAMNRLIFSAQEAGDLFFRSGYGEGLTDLFNTSAEFLRENEDLWKSLGAIVGSVLKGISAVIKAVTPVFSSLGYILKSVTDLLGDFSGVMAGIFSPTTITLISGVMRKFNVMGGILKTLARGATLFAAPFIGALAAIEEIINLFKRDKVGVLFDASQPDLDVMDNFMRFAAPDLEKGMAVEDDSWFESVLRKLNFFEDMVASGVNPTSPLMLAPQAATLYNNIRVSLEMDGEVVAEKVMETSAAKESMNRHTRETQLKNY